MDDEFETLFDDHFGEDELDDGFECHAYLVGGRLYCPIAGTEECDWECDR